MARASSAEFVLLVPVWHRVGRHIANLCRDHVVAGPGKFVVLGSKLGARAKTELVTGKLALALVSSRSRIVVKFLRHYTLVVARPKGLLRA